MELLQGKTMESLDRCSEGFNPLRLVQIPVIRQARCGRDDIPNGQDRRLDAFVVGLLGVVLDRLDDGRLSGVFSATRGVRCGTGPTTP
jgi:hypothetical protein